jgi:hypothetical protein
MRVKQMGANGLEPLTSVLSEGKKGIFSIILTPKF